MTYQRALLPEILVTAIMAKLSLTYGKRFTNSYDYTPAQVREHWAIELAGISEQGIRYALERLPADRVPNVLEFRILATQRPQNDYKALPAPQASPEVKRRHREALRGLREAFSQPHHDTLAWAERIVANPQGKSRRAIELATQALHEHGRLQ